MDIQETSKSPKDDKAAKELKKRTLTNLYNARPAWLDHAQKRLDEAVAEAYREDKVMVMPALRTRFAAHAICGINPFLYRLVFGSLKW